MLTPEGIKTASQLKSWHETLCPGSYFFARETMRFFGDTMKNYGLKKHQTMFELTRRRPVKHGIQTSHYFDRQTLKHLTSLEAKRRLTDNVGEDRSTL